MVSRQKQIHYHKFVTKILITPVLKLTNKKINNQTQYPYETFYWENKYEI